ncbi:FRG1-like family domain-containing protein [Trichoderma pleuroticola]
MQGLRLEVRQNRADEPKEPPNVQRKLELQAGGLRNGPGRGWSSPAPELFQARVTARLRTTGHATAPSRIFAGSRLSPRNATESVQAIIIESLRRISSGSHALLSHSPDATRTRIASCSPLAAAMVKPLTFKGDKKTKKRKRAAADRADDEPEPGESSRQQKLARSDRDRDNGEDQPNDDSWVSADAVGDVVGPVMIVLPTDKPSALACDPSGKVFALPIENIVDNNPTSAEPHDVRQVWVANRVAGTENFRFKGHHGRYLACDKIGLLSATSEAVSPLESFNIIATADTPGTFQLQTLRDTLLTIKPSTSSKPNAPPAEVRGDGDAITFNTTLRIRMQARFKPRLRTSKEEREKSKISRRELEEAAGRRLDEDEVRMLKRAKREGDYHERLLEIKVKNKHDKFG